MAGFFEGEGYFWSAMNAVTPYISANQVQKYPLERMKSLLGGSIHICKQANKYGNEKECSRWVASSSRAVGVMLTIYPLMSPKRKNQIRAVIEKWKSGKGNDWRGKITHCQRGHEFTSDNTYFHPTRGTRECRSCRMLRERKRLRTYRVNLTSLFIGNTA